MRFINPDSKPIRFLMWMADLLILQILVIVCSLPIFTIGTSITSMFSVIKKIHQDATTSVIRTFFAAFRENFKQSTVVWLIILAIAAVLGVDIAYMHTQGSVLNSVLLIVAYFGVIALVCESVYVFPLIAWFEIDTKMQMINAVRMAFGNVGKTLLVVLIYAVLAFVGCSYVLPLYLLMGITLSAYLANLFFEKAFARYIPEDTTEGE